MQATPLSEVTAGQLQHVLRDKTGEVWTRARKALADNDVCGAHLATYTDSASSLASFFADKLGCPLTPFVAEELLQLMQAGVMDAGPSPPSPPGSSVAPLTELLARLSRQVARQGHGDEDSSEDSSEDSGEAGGEAGGADNDDDGSDDGDGEVEGTALFRCTDLTTGEALVQQFPCPASCYTNDAEWAQLLEHVRQYCVAKFGDHAVEFGQVRQGMLRLKWGCVATNLRTNERKEFVLSSNDDDGLSSDPACRARFVRSIVFDAAVEYGWDRADTHVEVTGLKCLHRARKYDFIAEHRGTGQVIWVRTKTHSADVQFGTPDEQQAMLDGVKAHVAQSEGWAAQDTHIHVGKKVRVAYGVTNTATGQTCRILHKTVAPFHAGMVQAVETQECARRLVEAHVSAKNGWPAEVTRAEALDDPVSVKKCTFLYVAHNTQTDEKLHLSVSTHDARASRGTDAQKADFWRHVAQEYVAPPPSKSVPSCAGPRCPWSHACLRLRMHVHLQDRAAPPLERERRDGHARSRGRRRRLLHQLGFALPCCTAVMQALHSCAYNLLRNGLHDLPARQGIKRGKKVWTQAGAGDRGRT
jgi:hypothetical protein